MPSRLPAVLAFALVALTLLGARLEAQAPGATGPALRAGPAEHAATARLAAAPPDAGVQVVARSAPDRRRQGIILMIVGGAGIVTGILVDEAIVTIAGAGVAGFGLYLFLDSGGSVGVRVPVP